MVSYRLKVGGEVRVPFNEVDRLLEDFGVTRFVARLSTDITFDAPDDASAEALAKEMIAEEGLALGEFEGNLVLMALPVCANARTVFEQSFFFAQTIGGPTVPC